MRPRAEFITVIALIALMPAAYAQTSQGSTTTSQGTSSGTMPTVLELFTSQGCSSCPAADALLKSYAQRPGVIALSLSVDYWDHLGWKDTLASPKNTARQKAYAKALGTGNVYTPQIVINGTIETVGGNKTEIEKAIANVSEGGGDAHPSLTATSDDKRVTIKVASAGTQSVARTGTVWLMVVAPRVDVDVKKGENRGRTLSYHNVVRSLTAVGMWSGETLKIELPLDAVLEAGHRCAVLLQAGDGGRIIAATWMTP
jgi:hypothetical protein